MKLSIVIPNFNGADILEKNVPYVVRALEKYIDGCGEKAELIYVDDGSTDTSVVTLNELIKSLPASIYHQIILHKINKGFSSAVNTGVAHAKGEIVLLLNSDVRPEIGCIQPVITHFSEANVFAVCCMDKSQEGEATILRGRGIGRWERGFLMHSAGQLDRSNSLWASGGSSAFRKSEWDRLGGMNELYNPFYWEDIDLSYRALKGGLQVRFEKGSIVLHEHEKGAIKSQNSQTRVDVLSYRNQIQFVWLNITSIRLLSLHVIWLNYHIVRSLLTKDKLLYRGFTMAFQNLSEIRRYRSIAKQNFVISDESVLKAHRT